MAVYISASDETSGANTLSDFHHTGFMAPEKDWNDFFIPAWQERVLAGPPRLPYLHVVEMRSRAWRNKHNLSGLDADNRMDEAASVIAALGSLYPLKIKIPGENFKELFSMHQLIGAGGGTKPYVPDYFAFNTYVYSVLLMVRARFPEADRVDFVVEQKQDVTKNMKEQYDSLPTAFESLKQKNLIPLLGKFIPVRKENIPAQAADFLCWHSQREDLGTLDERDSIRWNLISNKPGFRFDIPNNMLRKLSTAFANYGKK